MTDMKTELLMKCAKKDALKDFGERLFELED